MVTVTFRATAELQSFRHRHGGRVETTYDGKPTTKLVGPVDLRDGDKVELTDEEFAWTQAYYAANFISEGKGGKTKAAKVEVAQPAVMGKPINTLNPEDAEE